MGHHVILGHTAAFAGAGDGIELSLANALLRRNAPDERAVEAPPTLSAR